MGQYISKYATIADYNAAVASGLDKPHTALVKENMEVYFHEYVPPRKDIITYGSEVKLREVSGDPYGSYGGLHTDVFNTTIKSHTFENGVGTIEFNDDVTSIGDYAFVACGLTIITIPNGVTSIGNYAFNGCSSLTGITCNAATAPTITSNTFLNIKTNGTLTVPTDSTGYDVWMGTGNFYLGKYGWTKVEQ